jgi:hypothetical protein
VWNSITLLSACAGTVEEVPAETSVCSLVESGVDFHSSLRGCSIAKLFRVARSLSSHGTAARERMSGGISYSFVVLSFALPLREVSRVLSCGI